MKKLLALLLVSSMVFNFSSCENSKTSSSSLIESSQNETIIGEKYLDTGLSVDERVSDLLSKMTLEQKAAQMVQE